MSLNDLYQGLATGGTAGLQKTASRSSGDDRQLAGHYYDIGRGMARAQFADMLKQAAEEGLPPEEADLPPEELAGEEAAPEEATLSEEDELAKRKEEMLARLEAEEAAAGAEGELPPELG
jgi:hypothetical protein